MRLIKLYYIFSYDMADYIKEIKKERISNITQISNKILSNITDNNIIKGNIFLVIHYILLSIYVLLVFFLPINRLNIILLICLVIIHNSINLYFGKWYTCILVKLERYFYDDLNWYGPNTPIFKIFGLNNRENLKYMQLINLIGWILLFTYYIYRIFKKFFSKNSIEEKKISDNKNK